MRRSQQLYLSNTPLRDTDLPIRGHKVSLEGEDFYQIQNYDRMRPFFMSVVSDADHWLFISSNGGFTAGRRDANLALFPYYTDDKIRDMAEVTGSKTILRVRRNGRTLLWEPFLQRPERVYRIRRNLYKSFWGNKLIFEEINDDLALTFRYGWFNSNRFGFVRRAWLINASPSAAKVELLDGIQNVMPCGTGSQFNLEYSTLLDAYKRTELDAKSGLALFRLSSIPIDRPEPAEALRVNVAWSVGIVRQNILLSSVQLDAFREGKAIHNETDVRAERGAYFVNAELHLRGNKAKDWVIVADVNQSACDVAQVRDLLRRPAGLRNTVLSDIEHGTKKLRRIVGSADGLQQSARDFACARHYSNTLFNIMRGGVFADAYNIDTSDYISFVENANAAVATANKGFFQSLPKTVTYRNLVAAAASNGDAQLERITREYLPLTFSRRHGDPSRPWNRFSITTRNADGSRSLNYEGNWRDIFQNWEALAISFPGFTSGMICRFLNASTADGYNPYRITRNGIDWEVVDPHDPWSYIGYWSDHQIIYLLKLLENFDRHDPDELRSLLSRKIFAYANVPYRIKSYDELLKNPKDTVVFDQHLDKQIRQRVQHKGADGKLVWDKHGQVRLVNLTEKLLVPLLVKISNFIPGAGLWLNTQRPEWNDANNALVGNGCSMVTIYYLRRYLTFFRALLSSSSEDQFDLSSDVFEFLNAITTCLCSRRSLLRRELSDTERKRVTDDLGRAGNEYRERIYAGSRTQMVKVDRECVLEFLDVATEWVKHSICSNRRRDGLFHAYNLVRFDSKTRLPIRRLYEMLEGQVAVLSSGQLSAEEALRLLRTLKQSAMYRADQHTYLLYPNRDLPRFEDRNNIPNKLIGSSQLLQRLLADHNRQLIEQDIAGRAHFNPLITNARDVCRIVDELQATKYAKLAHRDAKLILQIFEQVFDHESFTGRSGTFFGYEGLGSIYWHMVSKLLLAVQETFFNALNTGAAKDVIRGLADAYYDIRAGIGDYKTPGNYGAFPMDPYSHTPAQGGARQPGLTGQVKEDVICRFGELGLVIVRGRIHFWPYLLRREGFLRGPAEFRYFDIAGVERALKLAARSLAFTYCQTPVVYRLANMESLVISYADGFEQQTDQLHLNGKTSRMIFERTGIVERIEVNFDLKHFL